MDDGSVDRTLAVLKEMAAADRRIRYFSLSRNFGHQAALTAGMEQARGDVIISIDFDLQHPPEIIPVLLEKWQEGFDIVLTIRAEDQRLGLKKRLTSKLFYRIMEALGLPPIFACRPPIFGLCPARPWMPCCGFRNTTVFSAASCSGSASGRPRSISIPACTRQEKRNTLCAACCDWQATAYFPFPQRRCVWRHSSEPSLFSWLWPTPCGSQHPGCAVRRPLRGLALPHGVSRIVERSHPVHAGHHGYLSGKHFRTSKKPATLSDQGAI